MRRRSCDDDDDDEAGDDDDEDDDELCWVLVELGCAKSWAVRRAGPPEWMRHEL